MQYKEDDDIMNHELIIQLRVALPLSPLSLSPPPTCENAFRMLERESIKFCSRSVKNEIKLHACQISIACSIKPMTF
jgi:hypothetical protein